MPGPISERATGGPKKPRSTSSRLLEGALVGLVILFAGALLFFAIFSGVFGRSADKLPASTIPVDNVIPTTTSRVAPSRTPTRTLRPTWTPFDTITLIPTATLPIDAIDHWGEVIAEDPENADAYYQRATLYNSARQIGSQEFYGSQLDLALQDIDRAISLRSDIGDYYSLRQSIYFNLSAIQEYSVDREYLVSLAIQDAYKANELGTTIEQYPERTIIIDLTYTNQCQKALDEAQKLIPLGPAGDPNLGGLLRIRSKAYACLGQLEDALSSINDSMLNRVGVDSENILKAEYLVMLGKYDEALPILNDVISHRELSGDLYSWRAEIYYNTGKKDLVQNELDTGMPKTWWHGSMLPYVEAQMALDEGRKDEAIQLLQYAEATCNPVENPLRWKVQKLLASLGAKPLKLMPSAPYPATPLP
jgi:tetratricopeptide (TPR) repeat protein